MKTPYVHDRKVHNSRSARILVPYLNNLFKPRSVVDVGCGLGDWAVEFQKAGCHNVVGIDGDYVDRALLYIDTENFISHDLTRPYSTKRRYDLALCLEVAEHLPEKAAEVLVKTLCGLSDSIVFSAAIPGQGGQNHINEQPRSYWQKKFSKYGYHYYEILNEDYYYNPKIDFWYAENMVLVSKKKFSNHKHIRQAPHPDYYAFIHIHKRFRKNSNMFIIKKILLFFGILEYAKKLRSLFLR